MGWFIFWAVFVAYWTGYAFFFKGMLRRTLDHHDEKYYHYLTDDSYRVGCFWAAVFKNSLWPVAGPVYSLNQRIARSPATRWKREIEADCKREELELKRKLAEAERVIAEYDRRNSV